MLKFTLKVLPEFMLTLAILVGVTGLFAGIGWVHQTASGGHPDFFGNCRDILPFLSGVTLLIWVGVWSMMLFDCRDVLLARIQFREREQADERRRLEREADAILAQDPLAAQLDALTLARVKSRHVERRIN